MGKNIKALEEALKTYKQKSETADLAEKAYEENYESLAIEIAFDIAYTEEQKALTEAMDILKKLIPVDTKTARKMIITKGEEIIDLVGREA